MAGRRAGLIDRERALCVELPPPTTVRLANAFWNGRRSGQLAIAEVLLDRGADLN